MSLKKIFFGTVLALPFLLVVGFCVFLVAMNKVPLGPPPGSPPAEAAVVFTGYQDRIPTALGLLHRNMVKKVLISGVDKYVTPQDLALLYAYDKTLPHHVYLGKEATNTFENVLETAQWVGEHQVKRLYLITSNYHMPRSLLLLRPALPDVELIPWGIHIATPPKDVQTGLRRLRVVVLEYAKLLKTLGDGSYLRVLWGL